MKTFETPEAFEEFYKNRKRGYGQISCIRHRDSNPPYEEAQGLFVCRYWQTAVNYFRLGMPWSWIEQFADEYEVLDNATYGEVDEDSDGEDLIVTLHSMRVDPDDPKSMSVWEVKARQFLRDVEPEEVWDPIDDDLDDPE